MHWFARLVIVVGGNALALWAAYLWVPGFILGGNWITLVLSALVLANVVAAVPGRIAAKTSTAQVLRDV